MDAFYGAAFHVGYYVNDGEHAQQRLTIIMQFVMSPWNILQFNEIVESKIGDHAKQEIVKKIQFHIH